MKGGLTRLSTLVIDENPAFLVMLLLVLVGFSVYARALRYAPTDIDDVLILSSVAQVQNPAAYLTEDIGLGKNEYRPLHAISVWLIYRVVDVNVAPQQLLNIVLHILNACLLVLILRDLETRGMMLFVIPAMFLLSVYSFSPATWISDRPALLVTMWLLLVLHHFVRVDRGAVTMNLPYVLLLSLLALLSKESGLVVPLVIAIGAFVLPGGRRGRVLISSLMVLLCIAYLGFRFMVFGSNATAYHETGVIFGTMRYSDRADLPQALQYYALAENVLKNLLAPFMPVFDNKGGLFVGSPAPAWLPAVCATAALGVISLSRRVNRMQAVALSVIVVTSFIHYAVFRYRTQYVSEIAFCLFLGSSPMLRTNGSKAAFAKVLGIVAVFGSLFLVNYQVENGWSRRFNLLPKEQFGITDARFGPRVDKGVVERIRQRYTPASDMQ